MHAVYECVQLVHLTSHEMVCGLRNLKVDVHPSREVVARGIDRRELIVSWHQHMGSPMVAASNTFV